MPHILKKSGFLLLIFCLCLGLLWGFLALSALVPDEAIYDNMLKSALSYKEKAAFDIP